MTYPATFSDGTGDVRLAGNVNFTNAGNAPAPPAPPITSGSLPQLSAWSSGTAQTNPAGRAITVALAITGDATNNVATCAIAISPNNSDFTTLATVSLAAAVNNTGAITVATNVPLPSGWSIKLTLSHTTVATSSYY